MRYRNHPIVIAARASHLARTQAHIIGEAIGRAHPQAQIEYRWFQSEADRLPMQRLARAGGKGLFVRGIERALLDGEADVAVHSLKDVPADVTTAGLIFAAIPLRVDPRDCLVTAEGLTLDQLPSAARIGTASPRRAAQLLQHRPDLRISLLRGNVETRLRKVRQDRQFHATILAMAGLIRGGHDLSAMKPLDPDTWLPAAGQGALGVQCRGDDHSTLRHLLCLNDPASSEAVHAERDVVRQLGCNCHSAIGVLCEPLPAGESPQRDPTPGFRLRVWVGSPDGQRTATFEGQAKAGRLVPLARDAVKSLKAQGAIGLLKEASRC